MTSAYDFMTADPLGREYRLYLYVDEISMGTMNNSLGAAAGAHSIKTERGHNVIRIKKGEYRVPALNDLILRSDDPSAY